MLHEERYELVQKFQFTSGNPLFLNLNCNHNGSNQPLIHSHPVVWPYLRHYSKFLDTNPKKEWFGYLPQNQCIS